MVLHQPAARGQGPIPDLILQADEVVRMRADIEAILSAHTGQSVQTLRADTDRDRVLTAQAALEYGIVDQVLGQRLLDDARRAGRLSRACSYAARESMTGPAARDRDARGTDARAREIACWRRRSPPPVPSAR